MDLCPRIPRFRSFPMTYPGKWTGRLKFLRFAPGAKNLSHIWHWNFSGFVSTLPTFQEVPHSETGRRWTHRLVELRAMLQAQSQAVLHHAPGEGLSAAGRVGAAIHHAFQDLLGLLLELPVLMIHRNMTHDCGCTNR